MQFAGGFRSALALFARGLQVNELGDAPPRGPLSLHKLHERGIGIRHPDGFGDSLGIRMQPCPSERIAEIGRRGHPMGIEMPGRGLWNSTGRSHAARERDSRGRGEHPQASLYLKSSFRRPCCCNLL